MIIIIAYFVFWVLFITGIVKTIKWVISGQHKALTPSEKSALGMMIMHDK